MFNDAKALPRPEAIVTHAETLEVLLVQTYRRGILWPEIVYSPSEVSLLASQCIRFRELDLHFDDFLPTASVLEFDRDGGSWAENIRCRNIA